MFVGEYDSLPVEMWAIVDGMKAVASLGFHSVMVEFDSLIAI